MESKKTTAKGKNGQAKWTRVVAGVIAGLLAVLMFLSLFTQVFSFTASAVTQKEINALKDELANASAEKKKKEAELADINKNKTALKGQITALDAQIASAENEIDIQTQLIAKLDEQIVVKTTELAESQQKEDEQYNKLKSRVRFLYENGSMSYLEILLSADDFADFLSRYEIVSQVSTYEKKLFEELKATKESIAQQKQELEADEAEQVALKGELVQKKAELDKQLAVQQQKMKDLENAEADVKAAYAEIEAEEDQISADIKKKVAELAAQNSSKPGGGIYIGGNFIWPLPAGYTTISSPFGMRTHPVTGKYKLHTGTDISAPKGTSIYAANAGTVITSTYSAAYGNYVVINHGGGVATLYAHMSKRGCSKGDVVKQGDVIGYVGMTGYATGNHLHFEIIQNGGYIDPMTQFTRK